MSLSKQATIINESESKHFSRQFIDKRTGTELPWARSKFDSDPRIAEWVEQAFKFSLMSENRYNKIKIGTIVAAYFYPLCSDIIRYENAVKLVLILFIMDDHTECSWGEIGTVENTEFIWNQNMQALDKITDPTLKVDMTVWKPYTVFWYAVVQNICQELQSDSKKRFIKYLKDYALGSIEEISSRGKKFTNIEEIFKIRHRSIASYVVFALIEYTDRVCLIDADWKYLEEILLLGSYTGTIENDMSSFEKEYLEQDKKLNRMINVVAQTALIDDIPIQAAMDKMAELYQVKEKQLINACKKLLGSSQNDKVNKFIGSFKLLLGGNFKIGQTFDRYRKNYE